MALLHVSELPPQRSDEAFGLVRLASNWSRPEWRRCVAEQTRDGRGVLSATALGGVLLGLAAYRVEGDRLLGRVLRITLFVAFELGRKGATREALREELDRVAERLGCSAVLFAQGSRGLMEPALS